MKKIFSLALVFFAMLFAANAQVTVILEAHDVWGDGSGYQLLLDADHNTYGTTIPTSGGLTSSGDASASVYAEFEYKVPTNADGSLTTQNIVYDGSVSITIPAGTYDYCITNPTPNDRMWIASNNGPQPGRGDDFVFEDGKIYHFTISMFGTNDGVTLTVSMNPTTATIDAPAAIDFGTVLLNNTYTRTANVNAYLLTSSISAVATAPFLISADGTTFGSTATIAQAGGPLYVKYTPAVAGTENGTVILSSTGASNDTIFLSAVAIDCGNTPIPYSHDFTNANQNQCWTIIDANNDGSTFTIDEDYGYAYYYYNSTNNANDYLISPSFNFTGSQTIMFDYAAASSTYPEIFEVFAIGSDTVRLTQPTTVTSSTYTTETLNPTNLNGSYSIAFHCISQNDEYALLFTNFKVLDATSSIVDVTPASITFNTIPTGTTDVNGFNIATTNLNEVINVTTAAPFEVSLDGNTYATTLAIPADTTYLTSTDVYVRFAPTTGGTFTGEVVVTTTTSTDTVVLNGIGVECTAINTFPFSEDFSATSTTIPCWTIVDANNDGRTFSIGDGYASCVYSSTNPANDWLISPEFVFTGSEMGSFEYWSGSASYTERFEVYALGSDTLLLVDSVDVTNTSSAHETQYLTLSSLTGNYRIGIHCISDADQLRLYVANFNISAATTTMNVTPASIDFGTIPTGSTGNATINATVVNATSDITVTTAAPFSVSLDGNTYATSVTIPMPTSLLTQTIHVAFNPTAGTAYTGEVVISTTGAADTVALTGNGIACNVVTTFPFTETFTAASTTVDCWQIVDANNDGKTFTINTEAGQVIYSYHTTNAANDYLISPEFTVTSGLYGHIDYAVASSSYPEKFSIYVIPANGTLATATQIVPTQTATNTSFETQNFTFDAFANQTIRFAIKAESDANMYLLGFANFVIEAVPAASLEVDPTSMSFSSTAGSASAAQTANVTAYSLTNDITVTTAAPFEVSVNGSNYGTTATIAQGSFVNEVIYVRFNSNTPGVQTGTVTLTSGSLSATINVTGNAMDCSQVQALPFTENFEGELACWLNIDNDGDGYAWESSFSPVSYYPSSVDLSGQGHNASDGFYISGSYTNVASVALNPDNWLITPALAIPANGATLNWWIAAQDEDYAADHYQVMVSTTGTAISAFTPVYEETIASADWESRTVSLNNFANQNIHIAYVHNNCTDQFLMKLDDLSVTEGSGINSFEDNVSVYPNPANNVINVNASSNINTIEVFNMMGQKVAAFDANDTNVQINTTAMSNGMYMMRITTENGVTNQKFTVAR